MKQILSSIAALIILVSCSWGSSVSLEENDTITSENTPIQEKTILALGDSLTAWYWLPISESYPSKLESLLQNNNYNYKVINAGVSGDTSKNLLDRADLYRDQNPDIVLLVIGWNDGLRGQSIDTLKANIQSIIDIYAGNTQIVLWWMEIPANFWLKYMRDFKQAYYDIVDANKNIYFLESFLKDVWWVASLNQADRIHPTSAWYDVIVWNLYEFLEDEDIIKR